MSVWIIIIGEMHSLVSVSINFADLENWNGTDRHHFNAIVADQDLVEVIKIPNVWSLRMLTWCDLPAKLTILLQTYFPAFEACVREGFGASIMCSYNAVNGVPSCANGAIQNDIVRKQWGFQGFFVRLPLADKLTSMYVCCIVTWVILFWQVSDCGAIGDIMSTHK